MRGIPLAASRGHTDAERQEALGLWRGHCAACAEPLAKDEEGQPVAHFVSGLVPVHYGCASKPLRLRRWALVLDADCDTRGAK